MSATNAEVDAVNEAIQQHRIEADDIDARFSVRGMCEQRILVGDTVQNRRNNRRADVENRAMWTARKTTDSGIDHLSQR